MSESYQKLRKDFKELDFTDRLTFLAESVLLTGQSAVVGSLNIAGNVFDTVTGTVGAVIDASGIGNLLGSTGGVLVKQSTVLLSLLKMHQELPMSFMPVLLKLLKMQPAMQLRLLETRVYLLSFRLLW